MFQWTMPGYATDVGVAVTVSGMASLSPLARASWVVLDSSNSSSVLGSGSSDVVATSLGGHHFIANGLRVTGLRPVNATVLFVMESAAGLFSPQQATVPVEIDLFTVQVGGVVQGSCPKEQAEGTVALEASNHVKFLPSAWPCVLPHTLPFKRVLVVVPPPPSPTVRMSQSFLCVALFPVPTAPSVGLPIALCWTPFLDAKTLDVLTTCEWGVRRFGDKPFSLSGPHPIDCRAGTASTSYTGSHMDGMGHVTLATRGTLSHSTALPNFRPPTLISPPPPGCPVVCLSPGSNFFGLDSYEVDVVAYKADGTSGMATSGKFVIVPNSPPHVLQVSLTSDDDLQEMPQLKTPVTFVSSTTTCLSWSLTGLNIHGNSEPWVTLRFRVGSVPLGDDLFPETTVGAIHPEDDGRLSRHCFSTSGLLNRLADISNVAYSTLTLCTATGVCKDTAGVPTVIDITPPSVGQVSQPSPCDVEVVLWMGDV
jgi:hypothetical protein